MNKIYKQPSNFTIPINEKKWGKLSSFEQQIINNIEYYYSSYEDRKIDNLSESIYKNFGEEDSIRCDIFYKYPDRLILIEIENTQRPIESLTKYWWLLESTNWYEGYNGLLINYLIIFRPFIKRNKLKMQIKSRREQTTLIGTYLSEKYEYFNFNELTFENPDLSKEDLNGLTNKLKEILE